VREKRARVIAGQEPWRLKMIAFAVGAAALDWVASVCHLCRWLERSGVATGETLILLAAVIVGGRGRNLGALVGSSSSWKESYRQQLPSCNRQRGNPANFRANRDGVLLLAFLWWRPRASSGAEGKVPTGSGAIRSEAGRDAAAVAVNP